MATTHEVTDFKTAYLMIFYGRMLQILASLLQNFTTITVRIVELKTVVLIKCSSINLFE